MAHKVESMAYANETPWHGLGFKVGDDLSPAQILKAAKLDWKVRKEPIGVLIDGAYKPLKTHFGLVRDDNKVLSVVGDRYKEVQNSEAFDFFTKFVKQGGMKMETAGSLWGGRYVWALARLNHDFALSKGKSAKDEIDNYLLLMSPHVMGKALIAQYTSVRVVCWNTLSMALGSGLKGNGSAFRMPHSTAFNDDTKAKAELALGLAIRQADAFEEAARVLVNARATDKQVEKYFCEVLRFDPKQAEKLKSGEDKEPRALHKMRAALEYAPGANLATAKGTWWGALNAVTYVADHESGRSADTGLKSAWFGPLGNLKNRALDLAMERAAA